MTLFYCGGTFKDESICNEITEKDVKLIDTNIKLMFGPSYLKHDISVLSIPCVNKTVAKLSI